MLNLPVMTKVEGIVDAANELSDEEKRQAADRVLELSPQEFDAELEASLARGIADIRAGRATDFDDFLAELEAEDRDARRVGCFLEPRW